MYCYGPGRPEWAQIEYPDCLELLFQSGKGWSMGRKNKRKALPTECAGREDNKYETGRRVNKKGISIDIKQNRRNEQAERARGWARGSVG
jgi:hypothetical protein